MDPTGPSADELPASSALRLSDAIAARKASTATGAVDDVADEVELLCVRLLDRHYAIPIGQVAEVLSPTGVTRVPHLPAHVSGVFNRHGKVTAVLDLASFSGSDSEASPKRMVVLEHGSLEAAVPVSEVLGIIHVARASIEPPLAHLADLRFVTGQINNPDGILSVLDARILLENSRVRQGTPSARQ